MVVEDEDPGDPDLYGVFEGVPLTEGGPAPGELPNRIAIFRRPLEADFPTTSTSCATRSGSPSFTSSGTTSAWTRTGSQSSDTSDDLPRHRALGRVALGVLVIGLYLFGPRR